MSSSTFQIPTYGKQTAPFGSRLAAAVFVGIGRLFNAGHRASTPRVLSRAEEAADVRAFASRVAATDPGFAADLYAAAARHEGLDD